MVLKYERSETIHTWRAGFVSACVLKDSSVVHGSSEPKSNCNTDEQDENSHPLTFLLIPSL